MLWCWNRRTTARGGKQNLAWRVEDGGQVTKRRFEHSWFGGAALSDCAKITSVTRAQVFWPLARREGRAYPACGDTVLGARLCELQRSPRRNALCMLSYASNLAKLARIAEVVSAPSVWRHHGPP